MLIRNMLEWIDAAGKRKEMYLRRVGPGEYIRYELNCVSSVMVEWVSRAVDEEGRAAAVRQPDERTKEYSAKKPFSIAGKTYQDLNHFLSRQDGEWAADFYGRKVLCTKERFPCFDSYDYLYENRYYRWFFIREENTLSCLFMTDGRETIYVTEDVRNVPKDAWKVMEETGFCQPSGPDK